MPEYGIDFDDLGGGCDFCGWWAPEFIVGEVDGRTICRDCAKKRKDTSPIPTQNENKTDN